MVFTLVLITLTTYAQSAKTAGAFQYQLHTKTTMLNCDLFYNGSESVFVVHAPKFDTNTDTIKSNQEGSNRTIIRANINDGKDFALYKRYENDLMVSRELIVNGEKAIVNDSIPRLNWKLESQKQQIGLYNCQKATATFRCATYTVWFTTAIPLPIGPWKLGGLPGLIVEATNENIGLTYKLIRVTYPVAIDTKYPIEPPQTGEPIYSFAQFGEIQRKELKKMEIYLKSMAGNPSSARFQASLPECFDKQ